MIGATYRCEHCVDLNERYCQFCESTRTDPVECACYNGVMKITHATHLTDSELVSAVHRLASGERAATVALIAHLAEFDARRLYEGLGFPSTFKYCMTVLRLSEDATFNRIEAARAARRHPVIIEMLESGALSPTTARMIGRHLTAENHRDVLAAASGKSKQEVEALLAQLFPQADVRSSIRVLRSAQCVPQTAAAAEDVAAVSAASAPIAAVPASIAAGPPPIANPVAPPIAAERYEIRFTASAATREKLRRARELLSHAVPKGDLAEVFDRALTVLVDELERRKLAATRRPGASRGQSADSRHIPAAVKRAVVTRDGGRCAFVSPEGRRCDERRFLEFHHLQPYGAHGKPTIDNIALRCRAHNRYEAELFYGPVRRHVAGEVSERSRFAGSSIETTRSGTGGPLAGAYFSDRAVAASTRPASWTSHSSGSCGLPCERTSK
jgi:hypothetical protein